MISLRNFYSRLKRFPILLLIPFLSRALNLMLTPFMVISFGNYGFVEVSKLILLSYLLTVTIELGTKQKILGICNFPVQIIQFYIFWFLKVLSLLLIMLSTFMFATKNHEIIQTNEAIAVIFDSMLNVTINSFYLSYLQAKGQSNKLALLNLQLLFCTFIPKFVLLFLGEIQFWEWIFFGSVFRLLILIKPFMSSLKEIPGLKLIATANSVRIFNANSLNALYGLMVVTILTLDKWIGAEIYGPKEMVAYMLAFQFTSMTGSFFEQFLTHFYTEIRSAAKQSERRIIFNAILTGMVCVTIIFNYLYYFISVFAFPNLDKLFIPLLGILSFQSVAWGALLIWQNVLAPASRSIIHVKFMSISFFIDVTLVGILYLVNDNNIIHLALITASSFLICLIGIAAQCNKIDQKYFSSYSILFTFVFSIICSVGAYLIEIRNLSILILVGLVFLLLALFRFHKKYVQIIKNISGIESK